MHNLKELKIWHKAIELAIEVYKATGSSYELQTQLLISNRLNLLSIEKLTSLLQTLDELQKMNYGFQKMLPDQYV
jgi:hypothetical protein